MKDFQYLLEHFFTHKDFLPPAEELPGTLSTPLQFVFSAVILAVVITGVYFLNRHREKIKPVFIGLWIVLLIWEVVIVLYDTFAGRNHGFDWTTSLSLYPCSIFLYAVPFIVWGKGILKQMACGYMCTLGILGALVNVIFPIGRLTEYSCFSFAGLHTMIFHNAMLFVYLTLLVTGMHRYTGITKARELFYPCIFSLVCSIPANILNYSPINSDYMYFKGRFFVLAKLFAGAPEYVVTLVLYVLYILIPTLFYLPSYICSKRKKTGPVQEATPA